MIQTWQLVAGIVGGFIVGFCLACLLCLGIAGRFLPDRWFTK